MPASAAGGNGLARRMFTVAWLLLVQWPKGLYLHTKLVALACLAVLAR